MKIPRKVGIPKEIYPGECRVAVTPDTVKAIQKLNFEVIVESGAGETAYFPDDAYRQANCQLVPDAPTLWGSADIILKVRPPDVHEVELLPEGGTLIGFIWPAQNADLLARLAARKATVLAMDAVPRITRAQKMDALSSMANLAGYRAVIEAANYFGRFFTGQITAAGKVPPAKVLVIGAGVAGLAAIGAARSLGAVVRAFDTRLVVKEQIQSLGAEFLELNFAEDGTGEGGYAKVMSDEFIKAEMALFAAQAKEVDIIITTALIPGKAAPLLITQEMVESMKEGSVIVDMAAEQGGNCACTRPSEVYRYRGVTIVGLTDLPSRMAQQASQLYGTNLCHLLDDMGGADDFKVDLENEVVRGALVLHAGDVTWPPPKPSASPEQPKPTQQPAMVSSNKVEVPQESKGSVSLLSNKVVETSKDATKDNGGLLWLLLAGLALVSIGISAPSSF
ncbi:MAG: Re/Si-specific NAD(P)(+) transhydrogenase subunit alpha, partial [Chroococcidiopsidaceae cyanobacterium CP_BM_RX_35]|nr:Re/Si-specific NAD(P)(+) transhydrogenase subunit alpha [Chroococcidiopsidaceae cyanobacterium CP_BM_RX_35]